MQRKGSEMENIRPEVETFMRACERLFGFTVTHGKLTSEECDVLKYYADELQQQITPMCPSQTDPLQPDNAAT